MFKEQRTDRILEIIRENKYVTVDYLVSRLHYSPATIRRDLVYLANLGLINKSYGGVSYVNARPTIVREHEDISGKIAICKKAADLINDGDVIFIDGTTTSYFLGEVLLKKKNVTVYTANLKLAIFLGEHKVNCFVCGGQVLDSTMLGGVYTCDLLEKTHFDVSFFSVGQVSLDGFYNYSDSYYIYLKTVTKRSDKSVLLLTTQKIYQPSKRYLSSLSDFNTVITNGTFKQETIDKFPTVEFISVK